MKKLILGMATCVVLLSPSAIVCAQSTATTTTQEKIDLPEPPKFASEDANKEVTELVSLLKEYAPAIRANDTVKLMEFGTKMQTWQQTATGLSQLSPEEQGKFQTYMQSVGTILNPQGATAPAASEEAK